MIQILLSDDDIPNFRPKPLDCGRCEYDGEKCRLTELDKARCWARKSAKAAAKKALLGVGKETMKLGGGTYLVPDYKKYREALKEVGL